MKTKNRKGNRHSGLEAAVQEDMQGQQVLYATERAEETKKGMRARGFYPKMDASQRKI